MKQNQKTLICRITEYNVEIGLKRLGLPGSGLVRTVWLEGHFPSNIGRKR
jgi:hypothetical protein